MKLYLLQAFTLIFLVTIPVMAGAVYDYDGDGRTDFIVKRNNGDNISFTWYILQSRDGFAARVWGYQYPVNGGFNDGEIPGDFDGDGKWDITVRRSQNLNNAPAIWYIQNSSDGSMTAFHWGLASDKYVPQDYDGDGKDDFAVFRAGWWYILRSTDGQFQAERFGATGAGPLQGGDYDGDGKDDLAVLQFENGSLRQYIRYSQTGFWAQYALGNPQITGVVTGDFDGDGKADVAIWQGNNWLWERSSDGQLGGGIRFGLPQQDVAVPGDYDGDGKTDIAVFRNSGGAVGSNDYFYVLQSRDGFIGVPWGGGGNDDGNLFDNRYIRPTGFRPGMEKFTDRGPFPRLIATGKN